jgi:hypothetical protein
MASGVLPIRYPVISPEHQASVLFLEKAPNRLMFY